MTSGTENIFETLFNPKSIAVFGASSDINKYGSRFFQALVDAGFPGRLYPIHPQKKEVLGHKAYASIRDCPESVDYAIFCVPAHLVLELVEDCGANGLKAMQLFTAGFKESGEPEGIELENKLVKAARRHGIRVIGPNCIGIFCPEKRIPYGASATSMEPGGVGFLSQSGGNAGRLVSGGFLQGLRFSKVISYGNGCDLNAIDFLKFLGSDDKTHVIGGYIEGMEDVRPFFHLAKEISKEKPLVIWKGGQTGKGKSALLSHTGSLAGSYNLWEQSMKQSGTVMVRDIEELTDTLLTFSNIPYVSGNRLVMLTGLMGGGGGVSVSGTDISIQEGLDMINLSADIQKSIADLLPRTAGTILKNPIDTGSAMSLTVLKQVVELVLKETTCNIIVVQETFERISMAFGEDACFNFFTEMRDIGERSKTPIVLVWPPEASDVEGISLRLKLIEAGVTIYPSLRRAARAISNVLEYKDHLQISL